MRKYLSPFLALIILLASLTGCEKILPKAHLTATIDSYEYNNSTGFIEVYIKVVNDGERDVDYGEVFYRISYDSKHNDEWTNTSNIKVGKTRSVYDIAFVGSGKTIKSVSVTDVEWTVY